MPKKSDTREKVLDAADGLLQEGIRPTQQNVRERIGSGSITTINSALNNWWQTLSDRINRKDQHPNLPEPVISAANQLWDQALAYAHHSLNKEREEIQSLLLARKEQGSAQIEQLRSTVDQLQQQNTRGRTQSDELKEQYLELQKKLMESETALIRATSERDDLHRKNKQQEIIHRHSMANTAAHSASDDIVSNPGQSEKLFEARVESKLNIIKINELTSQLQSKSDECITLKEILSSQERGSLQQQHRLELVIAQQDTRYDEALKALTDCKMQLSLAKK
ncbi:DNA-binding protein [Neptunomonas antarctica]|uniref:Replication region DNA-binding N-term n=1 Tax=Neptunomonas antarctica TaxID=619304 RepID=A0A1N7LKD8_9GAMM|nr:DNA-binding protein [Neptunomonas antarctica]SIS74254.1 replication region DNA-binding N-term [Neptunomonas antarctica]